MKTIKARANSLDWQDVQQIAQQKKDHRNFRQQRQTRKGCWKAAE